MSKSNKKRGPSEISIDDTTPKRLLTTCMSHDFTILEPDERIEDYIRCMWDSDTTQLFDNFILKSRLNRIVTCRSTRNNTKGTKKLWYTTTCYLSGKIIILFFTMLRLFSINVGIMSKTEMTILWLIVEKLMWEILTTNSITHGSDPPSLELIDQTKGQSLDAFFHSITTPETYRDIRNSLLYITSVSRGELDRCIIINNTSEILSRDYRISDIDCGFINNKIPIIAGISITTLGRDFPSGIIHWFSFVINKENETIDIYSSWADGDYPIQSVMSKIRVDIGDFNKILDIFKFGTHDDSDINETIVSIAKYFFSNPPSGSKDVTSYLRTQFLTDDAIIPGGKFNIIIFPNYYKHCINVSTLLLEKSLISLKIRDEMRTVVNTPPTIYFDTNLINLKLLLIFLYTKSGCSNSGFYLEGDFGVKGGKRIKKKTRRRKTLKRKRRYTRRYKK
jgi:hypothetical protein